MQCHALAPIMPEALLAHIADFATIGGLPEHLLTRVPQSDVQYFISNDDRAAEWTYFAPNSIRLELDNQHVLDKLVPSRRNVTVPEDYHFTYAPIEWVTGNEESGLTIGIEGWRGGAPPDVWVDILLESGGESRVNTDCANTDRANTSPWIF